MSAEKVVNLKGIWDNVKKNLQILDSCPGPHEWDSAVNPVGNKKFKCLICGGLVDATEKSWYERGLAHGKRN